MNFRFQRLFFSFLFLSICISISLQQSAPRLQIHTAHRTPHTAHRTPHLPHPTDPFYVHEVSIRKDSATCNEKVLLLLSCTVRVVLFRFGALKWRAEGLCFGVVGVA